MLDFIIAPLANFVIILISSLGYAGIALAMAIESANIPLPSEIIMPFSGFMVSQGRFTLLGTALAGSIGGTLGSLASYSLGYHGGEKFVRKLIRKYGKFVLVYEYELDEAIEFFHKYGQLVTFTSRLLPVIRTFISLPAGIAKMDVKLFAFFAFAGTFIWSLPLAYIGMKLGENWSILGNYFHKFDLLIVLVGLAAFIWYITHKRKKHRHWQEKKKEYPER